MQAKMKQGGVISLDFAIFDTGQVISAAPTTATPQQRHKLIAIDRVADFDKWYASFQGAEQVREQNAGEYNPQVFRSSDDPNTVLIAFDVADIAKSRAFLATAAQQSRMQSGGVTTTLFRIYSP